jgi:hypothetical protein
MGMGSQAVLKGSMARKRGLLRHVPRIPSADDQLQGATLMDLSQFKEALGDEKFAGLKSYVEDLVGQRDAARAESIGGRKKLREDLERAQAVAQRALEKLGVENPDELDTLPDAKGQAEALKQLETRIKRAERERDEAKTREQDATGKYRGSLTKAALAEALSSHEFVARDIVETYVQQRLTWEGEDLLYKTDDGKLIPVKDGVTAFAKTRPELLKPQGTGGSGVRQANAGSGGGAKTMTRAEFEALPPADRVAKAKEGVTLT